MISASKEILDRTGLRVKLETETTELQQATFGRVEAFISELRTAFDEMKD